MGGALGVETRAGGGVKEASAVEDAFLGGGEGGGCHGLEKEDMLEAVREVSAPLITEYS